MKHAYLFIVLLFICSACERDISMVSSNFLVEDERDLSAPDVETAYKLCAEALNTYYKAIWNGSAIHLDTYIDNENLKQYMQKKSGNSI